MATQEQRDAAIAKPQEKREMTEREKLVSQIVSKRAFIRELQEEEGELMGRLEALIAKELSDIAEAQVVGATTDRPDETDWRQGSDYH